MALKLFRTQFASAFSLALIAFLGTTSAFAGGVSSGGGQVVKIDGHFRFLDMVSDSDLLRAEPLADLEKSYSLDIKKATFSLLIKQTILNLSVNLGKEVAVSSENVNFALSRLLSGLGVVTTTVPFIYFNNAEAISAGIEPSSRTSAKNQLVVGWFDGEKLNIQPYLFAQLNERDQEALLLHEAFRYYNLFDAEDHPSKTSAAYFSTQKIEKFVQNVMRTIDETF